VAETDVRRENTDVRWVGFHPLPIDINNIETTVNINILKEAKLWKSQI